MPRRLPVLRLRGDPLILSECANSPRLSQLPSIRRTVSGRAAGYQESMSAADTRFKVDCGKRLAGFGAERGAHVMKPGVVS